MFAMVLTHDAQLGLAELVHKRYSELWPDNGFTFRLPHNGAAPGPAFDYLREQPDCEIVPSGKGIKASMAALLTGVPDDDWVYWCIDDRFPVHLDARALRSVQVALDDGPDDLEEVKLLPWREPIGGARRTLGGVTFAVQRGQRERGFWHHHFARAGLLRRVFLRDGLAEDCRIDDVINTLLRPVPDARWTGRLRGRHVRRLPPLLDRAWFRGTALVPAVPLIRLAEPLVRGELTANGVAELRRLHCEVPAYPATTDAREYPTKEP
jgi:hypothetical protein